jgi:RNA polymerase sigma factor (sigma-70 family)
LIEQIGNLDQITWHSFREGDKDAFERMFLVYNPVLFSVGKKITSDTALVEDSIQEMFIDLWNKHTALPAVDTVKYYLIVYFRRILFSHLKENSRLTEFKEDSYDIADDSIEYKLIEEQLNYETQQKLKKAIRNLPHRQKEIIELRYLNSLSYDEIIEIMSINYTSSRKLVYKAIKNLKKHLKKDIIALIIVLLSF